MKKTQIGLSILLLQLLSTTASADLIEQIVMPSPASQVALANTSFSFDVNYSTNDPNETSTGLGLRMHFDSSKLDFDSLTDSLLTASIGPTTVVDDSVDDFDSNANTDMFVNIAWFDIGGNWPGANKLFTANFTTEGTFVDSTLINFTASDTAGTAIFSSTSAAISAVPEPGALTLSLVAVGSFAAYRYRRKKRTG